MKARQKSKTLKIGSVSHGTMREEDLIPCFIDEANATALKRADKHDVAQIKRRMVTHVHYFEPDMPDGKMNPKYFADEDLQQLLDILDSYCPEYCFFGSSQGDGSDYGCWPDIDSLMQDLDDGECVQDREKAYKGYRGYVVSVNDHGNVSLYNRQNAGHGYKDVLIWDCV